ncbi:CNNM domain-containing protein [Novosphingobium mangrovi (ex Hu et al. 2023)]|uniref:Hemolysin family protein n=1 Tax=Novosphingobium mangrovi (ex Hu et al. 2023) TaxID=2930094 RepID=A0ABT0ACG5_9SPHN|nr:hemolysin family protein [Novosphingobium mangrovi (ex Hu et al. 2023)]MCJ1960877.1 hemolysin family protein [Novosphingobium mangrovi (ex Hu et al. 2023)]
MALLVFYVALALCVSFLCSLLESSMLTLTPSQVRTFEQRGAPWARKLKRLKDDVDRPLAAILTLNTIAHTMGAAGAGAQYAKLYGSGSEAVFAALLTVAILIITEIIPKTIGARYASVLAPFCAWILPPMIAVLAPLVWASRLITKLIAFGRTAETPRHREELLAVTSLGQASGQIDTAEARFLNNMLQLDRIKTADVMTPRTVVFSLSQDIALDELTEKVRKSPFTRIPVSGEGVDEIRGFVIKHDVLDLLMDEDCDEQGFAELIRPLPSVLDQLSVDRLFHRFISEHHHILMVVDEYGSFLGLVTLEDVLETIFGFEIVDELDAVDDLQEYARELSRRRAEAATRMKTPAPAAAPERRAARD